MLVLLIIVLFLRPWILLVLGNHVVFGDFLQRELEPPEIVMRRHLDPVRRRVVAAFVVPVNAFAVTSEVIVAMPLTPEGST